MPFDTAAKAGDKQALRLKESEEDLVWNVIKDLEASNPGDAEIAKQRFSCLVSFGETIAKFPLIRESQKLLGRKRDDKQLVQSLVGLAPSSHLLHVPARILAVRSFLVTKFHAFSLLFKLFPPESEHFEPLKSLVFSVMFTIMSEDVYFSCLDEPTFPLDMKVSLAEDLISLWDSGSELAMANHFPALEALWKTRNESPPSFGTMDGTSELIRLSIDLGDDWRDFLLNQVSDEETRWALDEFLFGLSYEELCSVRSRLRRFGINAVDFDEIRSYLGSTPAYSMVKNTDPRAIYDFYIDRKEASLLRQRLNSPGPYKTLEEIYLRYRMNLL
jgi:hypothetical protein